MSRVITYIDGFNLYYGIREKRWRKYYWLDMVLLSQQLLTRDQSLVGVKYFTAEITGNKDKESRQRTFLAALTSHCRGQLEIIKGRYLSKQVVCYTHRHAARNDSDFRPCQTYHHADCNGTFLIPEEKKTDVNIATTMMVDAFQDRFDVAFLISADSDLVPPVASIMNLMPAKKVVVVLPPNRRCNELRNVVGSQRCVTIKEHHLQRSQLPDHIITASGATLTRPPRWN